MTQNQRCVSNQKIQTACYLSRVNRPVEQAVFALNGWIDRAICCQDKGRFWVFSFAVSGFWRACHIPIFLHRELSLRAQIRCFPSLHMGNIHTWIIHMWQIHTWKNHTGKIPHNKILNKEIPKNQVTILLNINLSILMGNAIWYHRQENPHLAGILWRCN